MPNTHQALINVVKQCFNLESVSVIDDLKATHIIKDIWEESDNPKKTGNNFTQVFIDSTIWIRRSC